MSSSIIYGTMNERDVIACYEFERPPIPAAPLKLTAC
jgi:hypothetical protein